MSRPRILLLDDSRDFSASLSRSLRRAFDIRLAGSIEEAKKTEDGSIELALVDIVLKESISRDRSGLEFLKWTVNHHPDIPVIVLTGHGDAELEVEALRLGAADYIEKAQLNTDLLRAKIQALLSRRREKLRNRELQSRLDQYEPFVLIGESPEISGLRQMISQLSDSDATVFITGESGVGKEIVARALHHMSQRRGKAFIAVNCAALTEGLLESELFGHEMGAYTGAHERRIGMFEKANGGTLLLDEVTEIEVGLQAKLLRAIQEKQVQRIGNSEPIPIDVRILATTNRAPEEAVEAGKLRRDLYYRLNVLRVEVPPLRNHRDDIPLLADHFLSNQKRRRAIVVERFNQKTIELFRNYEWPGNVRELENIIERACTLCRETEILPELVAPWIGSLMRSAISSMPDKNLDFDRRSAVAQLETIEVALVRANGKKNEAQRLLGFSDRSTMRRRIAKLRADYPDLWMKFPVLRETYGKKKKKGF